MESYLKQRAELASAVQRHELAAQVAQKRKRKTSPREGKRWRLEDEDEE
jgi:ribosome biogenesis GTPase